ncbi:MAG: leader peptidase (prepilin peptidase) / N-methyltransferase [Actinomycetota bacterium]|jgi:leader peptidase (prepilin peptidase)/N-methyltransferase|nr:leader peptidase (prepilin peptidase) / N-methyltransferase [Actinomycetota bacterium]
MHGVLVLMCGLFGLIIGSFLNVVIWRVPRKLSVVRPPSHCPQCETPIRPIDNIPVVAWLALRGKCRHCGNPIPVRYPLVEAGCGVLFAAVAARFGSSWALPAFLVLTAALLAISIIDLEHFIVPDRITAPLTVSALALLGLAAAADGDGWRYGRVLLGGLAFFAFLLLLNLLYPRGMGMGDVKLSFSLGLYLGWLGWGQVFLGGFLAFLLGALVGVGLIATGVKGRKDFVPFGPFLAAGTMIVLLWGEPILRWYTGS